MYYHFKSPCVYLFKLEEIYFVNTLLELLHSSVAQLFHPSYVFNNINCILNLPH